MFQRYYQSSRTIKNDKEGTGIGLAIVKEYVEMHNGTVLLTSDSNGTTVQLTFPINIDIQEQEEIIEKPTTTENKEDTRPLIAIVEDNTYFQFYKQSAKYRLSMHYSPKWEKRSAT